VITADERLRDIIFGGPGDRRLWVVMVILAARADEKGIVRIPDDDEVGEWINRSAGWARWSLDELQRQGWLHPFDAGHWDIGRELRKGTDLRLPY
jgi:hypothetical protein